MPFRSLRWKLQLAALAVSFFLSGGVVRALSRGATVVQAQHTVWRLSDGAPSNVADIAQTSDGFLWLASPDGLRRFDGQTFLSLPLSSDSGTAIDATSLMAEPENDELWVGTRRDGVAVLRNGTLVRHYGVRDGLTRSTVYSLRRDSVGTLWSATSAGVYRLDGATWRRAWPLSGAPGLPAANLLRDRTGQLCFTTDGAVLCKQPDAATFTQQFTGAVEDIALAPGGVLWVWVSGSGISPLFSSEHKPVISTDIPHGHMIFGESGDLWIVTYGHGLNRFVLRSVGWQHEVFDRADGLQSSFLHSVFEDREGNLWLGSTKGLERFRTSKITAVPALGDSPSTVLLANGADVWAGVRTQALQTVTADNHVGAIRGAPVDITAAYRDPDGSAWFGASPYLWHEQKGQLTPLRLPEVVQGSSDVQAISRDSSGTLWVSVVRFGVFCYSQGKWTRFERSDGNSTEYALAFHSDAAGRFWISYHGKLYLLQPALQRVFESDAVGAGDVQAMISDGQVLWAAGQKGLAFYRADKWHVVHSDRDEALQGAAGIVRGLDGALWIHSRSSIVRIAPDDVSALSAGVDRRVPVQSFSFEDGLPGMAPQIRPLPSAVLTSDGRVWTSTASGVGWIDPAHLPFDSVVPSISVQNIQADGVKYPVTGFLSLAPHVRALAISYTAPSLSVASGNHYRYRLIGFDNEWQDGGTRQTAYFTNLPYGNYRFEVEAVSPDGVKSANSAVSVFRILPAFYQKPWFRLLACFLLAVVMWLIYRLRLRVVTERIRNLLAERLAERERIAGELHDTLLQGVQGLILLFQSIAFQMPEDSALSTKMNQALDRAERLMSEGRDSVRDLRTSSLDMEAALRTLVHEQSVGNARYSLEIEGEPRELQLLISDEVFKIVREAVSNSFQHAEATSVQVTLAYSPRSLDLFVEDDGKGIPPEILRTGRHGHWGLVGMRDRARKLQGEFTVSKRADGSGTRVRLSVPARVAYRYTGPFAKQWFAKKTARMGA